MPSELVKRINLDEIYLPFLERSLELAADCRSQGADYYAISGFRSFADQAKLYFHGRTTPGKVVTNARPGQSAHNYGIAIDWCRDGDSTRDGLQPAWNLKDYELLARTAKSLGLDAAYYWKTFQEGPHVQLNLQSRNLSLPALKLAHDAGGIKAVWALLDKHGPWF